MRKRDLRSYLDLAQPKRDHTHATLLEADGHASSQSLPHQPSNSLSPALDVRAFIDVLD